MKAEGGLLKVDGEVWYSNAGAVNLKPTKRNIGMVFQEHSLFPNMSIAENLEFALSKGQSPQIVQELLERVGLKKMASKKALRIVRRAEATGGFGPGHDSETQNSFIG